MNEENKSIVYFTDLRADMKRNLLDKLDSLLDSVGLEGRFKRGHLAHRSRPAIKRDHQFRPLGARSFDQFVAGTVAVFEPVRQERAHVRAARPQGGDDDRGRRDAVHIVIAEHEDAFAARDRRAQALDRRTSGDLAIER